eukprot:15364580-Ditylum_brightwellii.AAC.1
MQAMSQDVIDSDKTPRTPQGQNIIHKRATRTSAKVKQSLPTQCLDEPRNLHVMDRIEGNGWPGCEFCKFLWKTKKFNG